MVETWFHNITFSYGMTKNFLKKSKKYIYILFVNLITCFIQIGQEL